jgi:hypothetical protein
MAWPSAERGIMATLAVGYIRAVISQIADGV